MRTVRYAGRGLAVQLRGVVAPLASLMQNSPATPTSPSSATRPRGPLVLAVLTAGLLLASAGCGDEPHEPSAPQADAQTGSVTTVAPPAIPEQVKEEVRFRVDSGYNVSIVVGMVNPAGSTYFTYGATAAGNGQAPTADTVFEIGSITKAFTTLLLADMARRGEVSLDDPIADYLPSTALPPAGGGRTITLSHLATHTAGLPRLPSNLDLLDRDRPYAGYTVRKLYRYLAGFTPPPDTGRRYSYSNLGGGLLGHILELRTGSSYEELVTGRITTELGMPDTRIAATPGMRERLARGHSGVVEVPNWENTTLAGSGRLLSTARDMVTFLAASLGLRDSPLLASMRVTHEPRLPTGQEGVDIALGWHVRTVGEDQIVWHDGGTGGYSSYAGFVRDGDTGVVVLSNTFQSVNDIGLHLLAPSVPLDVLPAPAQIDSATLDRYVGSYRLGQAGTMVVGLRHGHLTATFENEPTATLYPESEDRFYYLVANAKITFVKDESGRVAGLVLHQARIDRTAVRTGAAPDTVERAAAPSEIILTPFANEDFGIRGVVPAGWIEFIPGGYKRAASNDVALYQQVAGGGASIEDVLRVLAGELGLDQVPESTGVREANGITWRLYAAEVQGQSVDIAIADHGTLIGSVVLRSRPSLREFYRAEVFLPAVDALTVIE